MDHLKQFWEKYAIWTFLVGAGIGALVAYNQIHN